MLESGLTMGEVRKYLGGLLSLGIEKQTVNVSVCMCILQMKKGNPGEKGSHSNMTEKILETCGTKKED